MKVKLSELYDIGSSKRVFQSEWREEGVPFYRAREIAKLSADGYVDNELFIDEELYAEYVEKYGKPETGDVMVTGVGTLGVCYVVKPNDRFYFKDGNILWFKQKATDRILPEYLAKAFDSKKVKEFIGKNSSGTTVGTFTIQTAKKMEISLPSIEEQKSIISKISQIESIIKQRKRELSLLDNLIKARFVELFGECNSYEKLENADVIISDGNYSSKYPTSDEFVDDGVPFIRASNMVNNTITDEEMYFISEGKHAELLKGHVKPYDVLIATRGAGIGKIAVVPERHDDSNINAQIVLLRCNIKEYNPLYLSWYLKLHSTQVKIQGLVSGSAQPQLPIKRLIQLELLKPEIAMQNKFADFVKQVDKSKVINHI